MEVLIHYWAQGASVLLLSYTLYEAKPRRQRQLGKRQTPTGVECTVRDDDDADDDGDEGTMMTQTGP